MAIRIGLVRRRSRKLDGTLNCARCKERRRWIKPGPKDLNFGFVALILGRGGLEDDVRREGQAP